MYVFVPAVCMCTVPMSNMFESVPSCLDVTSSILFSLASEDVWENMECTSMSMTLLSVIILTL